MSSAGQCHPSASHTANTATEDPFISPEFHLRNRSLSATSDSSIPSSAADFCARASPLRCKQVVWYCRPSYLQVQAARLGALPIGWLSILLCLTVTFLVWHLPPPSAWNSELQLERHRSAYVSHVLQPCDSRVSCPTDPERWLRENSEDAVSGNGRWWKRRQPKVRAAIISLVRNEELEGIMQSMRQLEHHWNRKYQYPWVFFNEKPFNDEFKVASELFLHWVHADSHAGCHFKPHLGSNVLRAHSRRTLVNTRMD